MSATVFDTLAYSKRLQAAGVPATQAEAQAEALAAAISNQLATKADITEATAPIRTDVAVLKWMVGFNIALSVGILAKMLA